MKKPAQVHSSTLVSTIEEHLGWGRIKDWSNYDFEKLSEIIQSETGVSLSITTLKRVLGRINYPHAPSTTTLNALAQFLGYDDWRAFQQVAPTPAPLAKNQKYKKWQWALPFLLGALIIVLITNFKTDYSSLYQPDDFEFKADKIYSEGVPNSVIFTYDAQEAKTDSIFIVQTWDISRKTLVPKSGRKHSALYYYPGFFRTKLIIGEQIVKMHDLQISSDGWLSLIDTEDIPVYLDSAIVANGEGVSISKEHIEANGFDLLPNVPKVLIFNQRDLGPIRNDNFEFETQLKNPFNQGTNACQYVEVLIQCKNDIIIIPLCNKECVGKALLYAAGVERDSKNTDLSKFGADLNAWTKLRVEAKNQYISFYVNDIKAEGFQFPNPPTEIVGVQYRFNGPAAVKHAQFKAQEKVIKLK